jgi:hypothetical protein
MAQDSVTSVDSLKVTLTEGDPNQKTVEINGHTYTIRKWTWREKDQAAVRCYERIPGQRKGRVDLHQFNILTLQTCVVKWPSGINVDTLTPDEGDDLIAAVQEFAGGFREARPDPANSPAEGKPVSMGP